ncbi:MAG: response regulator [Eubacteriales bacterium]|nr:response regulator [Eubacteriales bacterium]
MKRRVLIIEDNLLNRKMLAKILEQEYEVLEAVDGREGLAQIQKWRDELAAVVLDLRMPEMDGFAVMAELARTKIGENLPIVVTTGETDPQLESRCLKAGAWDFVSKPYNAAVIRLRLHNVIGRSQAYLLVQMKQMAERDEMTGIYNRKYFMQKTREMLQAHPDTTYALIRMDVDHFRLFNSSYGTAAGDQLLISLAKSIRRDIVPGATYGRIESDVFCICAPYSPGELEARCKQAVENRQSISSEFFLKLAFGISRSLCQYPYPYFQEVQYRF